jgi:leader peptidase (prepilin peptidase) / N-methyltransferase
MLMLTLPLATLAVIAFGPNPEAIPALYLAAVSPELVRVDLREHRLPNRMVVPGIAVSLVACALAGSPVPLVAALAVGGFLWLLGVAGGIGMGDVKLAVLLGLASPTPAIALAAPLAAFLLGGAAASIALVRHGQGTRIAFGPCLLAGYGIAVVPTLLASSIAAGAP